ncbi:MAG: NGG1p interacting factor NIF3 [Spirochaetales bacterium]|nr:NGG1p interacting factor NIF3 [Spirochaetales bacterium]
MYQLIFFAPVGFEEKIKEALFAAGAGKYNDYDKCCWQCLGKGQFRPLEGSEAFIGNTGTLEKVEEYRIEMLCQEQYLKKAIEALKESHPYEEPAYYAVKTFI